MGKKCCEKCAMYSPNAKGGSGYWCMREICPCHTEPKGEPSKELLQEINKELHTPAEKEECACHGRVLCVYHMKEYGCENGCTNTCTHPGNPNGPLFSSRWYEDFNDEFLVPPQMDYSVAAARESLRAFIRSVVAKIGNEEYNRGYEQGRTDQKKISQRLEEGQS